ncbi:hypothetical protein FQA39_LY07256 [Lamprigera yunnana]|nr:hypothetical protein FQA39_LY07256 [Lamprigera yunnana]
MDQSMKKIQRLFNTMQEKIDEKWEKNYVECKMVAITEQVNNNSGHINDNSKDLKEQSKKIVDDVEEKTKIVNKMIMKYKKFSGTLERIYEELLGNKGRISDEKQFNYNPQVPTNNQHKQNFFPRGPINIQNRPITTRYPTNNEVFGKKIESRPTLMSISTRNTNANYRPNFPKQQNVFQSNGPRNFKSEELFNINEGHNDSEPIQDDFEDPLVDYNEDLIEADENDESN